MRPDPGRKTHDETRPHHCRQCATVYLWFVRRVLNRQVAL